MTKLSRLQNFSKFSKKNEKPSRTDEKNGKPVFTQTVPSFEIYRFSDYAPFCTQRWPSARKYLTSMSDGRYLGFGVCCTSLVALATSLLAVINWEPLNWHFMHNFLLMATT